MPVHCAGQRPGHTTSPRRGPAPVPGSAGAPARLPVAGCESSTRSSRSEMRDSMWRSSDRLRSPGEGPRPARPTTDTRPAGCRAWPSGRTRRSRPPTPLGERNTRAVKRDLISRVESHLCVQEVGPDGSPRPKLSRTSTLYGRLDGQRHPPIQPRRSPAERLAPEAAATSRLASSPIPRGAAVPQGEILALCGYRGGGSVSLVCQRPTEARRAPRRCWARSPTACSRRVSLTAV
jgi:hypothetical protein